MIFKLLHVQKTQATKEQVDSVDGFYLARYVVVLSMFAGVLVLSMLNDFLFFSWLSISSAIIGGLMSIHLMGQKQIKRD
jgi:hypothetical protein